MISEGNSDTRRPLELLLIPLTTLSVQRKLREIGSNLRSSSWAQASLLTNLAEEQLAAAQALRRHERWS